MGGGMGSMGGPMGCMGACGDMMGGGNCGGGMPGGGSSGMSPAVAVGDKRQRTDDDGAALSPAPTSAALDPLCTNVAVAPPSEQSLL